MQFERESYSKRETTDRTLPLVEFLPQASSPIRRVPPKDVDRQNMAGMIKSFEFICKPSETDLKDISEMNSEEHSWWVPGFLCLNR